MKKGKHFFSDGHSGTKFHLVFNSNNFFSLYFVKTFDAKLTWLQHLSKLCKFILGVDMSDSKVSAGSAVSNEHARFINISKQPKYLT